MLEYLLDMKSTYTIKFHMFAPKITSDYDINTRIFFKHKN